MEGTELKKSQKSVERNNLDSLKCIPKILEPQNESACDTEEKLNELLRIAHEQSRLAHEQSLATELYDFQNKCTTDVDLLKSLFVPDDFPNTMFTKDMDNQLSYLNVDSSVEENMEKLFKGTVRNSSDEEVQTDSDIVPKNHTEEENKVDSTVTSTTQHDQVQSTMRQDIAQDINESMSSDSDDINGKDDAVNGSILKRGKYMEGNKKSYGASVITKPQQVARGKINKSENLVIKMKHFSVVKNKGLKRAKLSPSGETASENFFNDVTPGSEALITKTVPWVGKEITVTTPTQLESLVLKQDSSEKIPCVLPDFDLTSKLLKADDNNMLSESTSSPTKVISTNETSPLMKLLTSRGISILKCDQNQQYVAKKLLQPPVKQQSKIRKIPSFSEVTVLPVKNPFKKLVPSSPFSKTVQLPSAHKVAPLSPVYKTVPSSPACNTVGSPAVKKNNLFAGWQPSAQFLQCGTCHLNFQNSVSLKNHIKTSHESPQMYRCSLCMNIYNTLNALMLHRQSEHGDQQHVSISPRQRKRSLQQDANMGIPIVNLQNPQTVERLKELGISGYIPVIPSWVKDGNVALPAIPVASSMTPTQFSSSKSEILISLGAVKQINQK